MEVPPIIRGEFQYRDVLLVDCGGDLKRHARASEAEIKRLLTGKDIKDQVAHWWEAQAIHYGLQRSKQKDTCKVRLQQALNQGKLKSQPPHLADMEGQMKKEYAAAFRKAKAAQAKAGDAPTPTPKGKKRAREGDEGEQSSKKTKVSIKVGGVAIDIEDESSTKKQKATNPVVEKKETKSKAAVEKKEAKPKAVGEKAPEACPAKTSKPSTKPKKAASELASADWTGDPRAHPDNVFQQRSSQQETMAATKSIKPKKEPIKKETVKKEPIKKEAIKKESRVKDEAGVKNETPVKNEPTPYDDDEMDTRHDITQEQLSMNGVYTLTCPQLAEQAPEYADKFRIFLCVDDETGKIWGGFELAWKSGHIKIGNITSNTQLTMGWRARDYHANGSLRFGTGCNGAMELPGHGHVRGTFYNLFPEPLHFEGVRRPGPLWSGKSARKWQQEWDEYPREAYGR